MSKTFPALMAQWQERLPISMTLELIGMRKIDGKLTVVVQVVNHNKTDSGFAPAHVHGSSG
jgi:hypothetical protein